MKKVIHLMSTDDYSGAEKVAMDIIDGLKNEYEFIYVTRKGKINKVLEEKNVKYINIKKLSIKEVRRVIKECKPDIIHAHDYRASVIAALSFVNIPIISHLHNNSPWLKKINLFSIIFMLISFRIKRILAVSKSIENEYVFSSIIKNKIKVVSNPVSRESILDKIPKDTEIKKEYDICFSGRLTKQKNPIKFIEIVSKVKEKNKNIKVVMLGDGELRNSCKEKIRELNLEDNIRILGFVKDPYVIMAQSKIFCLTSDWEGYGLVAFEALTLGLPCIVSNVGGLVDIVDESCGKLCTNKQDFVNSINNILIDINMYNILKVGAINKSKKLDNFDEYMKNINKCYQKIKIKERNKR